MVKRTIRIKPMAYLWLALELGLVCLVMSKHVGYIYGNI